MNSFTKSLALLGCFAAGFCSLASAQDSGALLDALVKKGILSDQEAEEVRADLTRDSAAALPKFVGPGGRNTTKLALSGRIQAQYINLDTSVSGGPADPQSVGHFMLRRVYLGARADFGPDWNGLITYDFSGGFFDAAFIQYKGLDSHTSDVGLRKVNFGYEERTSSGSLKAIERSGVTRYFVEDNNGRRLGAGSYRVGAFIDGTQGNFFYGAAITNLERPTSASGASAVGAAGNNELAYWANAGIKGKSDNSSYTIGAGLGYLPGQASSANPSVIVAGDSLVVGSVYADFTFGNAGVLAEVLYSDNNAGVGFNSWGFYIQPTYKLSEQFELVGRVSYLDTDGRGVQIGDGVRSAASVGTFDKLTDYYLGMNYYFKGNDVKLSAGLVYAETDDALAGTATANKTVGLRTQMQVNF